MHIILGSEPVNVADQYAFVDSAAGKPHPDPDVNRTCGDFLQGGATQCIALWTYANGLPRTANNRKKRSYDNPVGNDDITVT